MLTRPLRAACIPIVVALALSALVHVQAQNAAPAEPQWGTDQITGFLTKARILRGKQTSKGITSPWRLTMTDGTVTHDAAFQAIDDRSMKHEFGDGTVEFNFVDSYQYDVAAYEIAKLVGLGTMMPVTIVRKWEGKSGALSWWVPTLMDESDRLKKKISPPMDVDWNGAMHRMRVFTALVYDTDRNLTNVLIDHDWNLWMIDFTRAFRVQAKLVNEKDLVKMDRLLFARIKTLARADVERATKNYLIKNEIDGVMKRRDLIVQHFDKLIAAKGEKEVLY